MDNKPWWFKSANTKALEKIEKSAKRKLEQNPDLTFEKAVSDVLTEEPDLYTEYLAEPQGEGDWSEEAMKKIDRLVAKMMRDNPTMTKAQAMTQVVEENPDLYEAYKNGLMG